MKILLKLFIVFTSLVIVPLGYAQYDLNGNGTIDLPLTLLDGEQLRWFGQDLTTDKVFQIGLFGHPSYQIGIGHWITANTINRVYVRKNEFGDFELYADSKTDGYNLGQSNDSATVIIDRDVDSSGLLDAVLVNGERSKWAWKLSIDPLSINSKKQRILYGSKKYIPFLFRARGKYDSLAILKVRGNRTTKISYRSLLGRRKRKIRFKGFTPPKEQPLLIRDRNNRDFFGFIKDEVLVSVNRRGRKEQSETAIPKNSSVLIGNFREGKGEEITIFLEGKITFIDGESKRVSDENIKPLQSNQSNTYKKSDISPTLVPTYTPTGTAIPTASHTITPSSTPTLIHTPTITATHTPLPTWTMQPTYTALPTATPTFTPTSTATPPSPLTLISSNPSHTEINVGIGRDVTLTFSEDVTLNEGENIILYSQNDTRVLDVNSSQLSINQDTLTIKPYPPLNTLQTYSVLTGKVHSLNTSAVFGGLYSTNSLTFTTASSLLTPADYDDPGSSAADVFFDGSKLFVANRGRGLEVYSVDSSGMLTHLDNDDQGGEAYGLWGNEHYIFLANRARGIESYSVDHAGLLTHHDNDTSCGDAIKLWGDDNYIYVACKTNGLFVYSVDNTGAFTLVYSDNQGGDYRNVWGDGKFLYVANYSDGVEVYSVDSSGMLTHISNKDEPGLTFGVWGDGKYLYASQYSQGIYVYTVDDNGILTEVDHDDQGGEAWNTWGDGEFLYVANGSGGVQVYSVNALSGQLNPIENDYQRGNAWGVYGSNEFIFLASHSEGVDTYQIHR